MGSTSRYGRATINPTGPSALGICDRCGILYNLRELRWQFEWCGTTMQNLHLRVCSQCWDVPQQQLRTIILPPDPPSVRDPRTEPFAIDERNELTLSKIIGKPSMFFDEGTFYCELESGLGLEPAFAGAGDLLAAVTLGIALAPSFADTGAATAALLLGIGLTAPFADTGALTADVDVVAPSGLALDYTDAEIFTSVSSPYTFTGADIGAADADRLVFVFICGQTTAPTFDITAVTVGGVGASCALKAYGDNSTFTQVWFANVPTGTTANIALTHSATTFIGGIAVYRVLGVDVANPFDNVNWNVIDTAGGIAAAIDVPATSGTMAAALTGYSGSPTTSSWTNITEDVDLSADPGIGLIANFTAASRTDVSGVGALTVTATPVSEDAGSDKSIAAVVVSDTPDVWIAITATDTAWAVPADWNNADNSVHVIADGATATDPGAVGAGGCGGGAWARTDNLTLTPGGTARAVIGGNGVDSYFSNTGGAPTSTSEGCLAKAGVANSGATGGAGGASGACIGHAANSGGTGGAAFNGLNGPGGGGGGAGGPNGVGGDGGASSGAVTRGGAGGGGANGGTAGVTTSGTGAGAGGENRLGFSLSAGSGTVAGLHGAGGAGGAGTGANINGGPGGMEALWRQSSDGAFYGPGGGGGGGKGNASLGVGGAGGSYGGGAGGSSEDGVTHSVGGPGLIMVRYKP